MGRPSAVTLPTPRAPLEVTVAGRSEDPRCRFVTVRDERANAFATRVRRLRRTRHSRSPLPRLRSELAEVVIHVLVLGDTPFRTRHSSEKTVNISIAALLAQCMKFTQKLLQPFLRGVEVGFVLNNKIW